jgi:hypothetical protein
MAQTGQAAKSIKKKTDAMPKASTGKLLKDAAVTAAMFTPPGRILKAVSLVSTASKAAKAAQAAKELRITKGLVGKKGQATLTRAEKAKITPTPAQAKAEAARKKLVQKRSKEVLSDSRVPLGPKRKPLERIPSTKAVALEPKPNIGGGLRTTTGQGRKPLPAKDVTAITKERTLRPSNSGRARDVKKPSSKELSPSEKAADIASKKSPVAVTRKKPMSLAEIKKAKAVARKAKFDRVLTPRPKPKPNRAPLKPIDKSRGSNRPVQPKLNDEQQVLKNAENNPLNSMYGGKPKPNIAEGRGNVQQPSSVTTSRIRSTSRQLNRERRKAKQANRRDIRADIAGAQRADYKKPRVIKYTTGPKSAKPGTTKRIKIGDQTVSRTNDPRNAVSDAGNMRERLRAIDAKTIANRKRRAIGKGGNKISPELKAKVNATLGSSNKAKKGKALQNTFNKPKFSRNVTTGRLTATRPIKPVKK